MHVVTTHHQGKSLNILLFNQTINHQLRVDYFKNQLQFNKPVIVLPPANLVFVLKISNFGLEKAHLVY